MDVRDYNVIYEAINDAQGRAGRPAGAGDPRDDRWAGRQVRQIFVISKLGPICRLARDGGQDRPAAPWLASGVGPPCSARERSPRSSRFKDDVREVLTGLDCGIGVESVNGLQPGDIIEAYTSEEVARTL